MFVGLILLFWTTDVLQQCKHEDSCSLVACEFRKMGRYFDKVSPPPQKKKGESSGQSSKYKQEK